MKTFIVLLFLAALILSVNCKNLFNGDNSNQGDCALSDNSSGKCVRYYLCDETGSSNFSECPSALDVCCKINSIQNMKYP